MENLKTDGMRNPKSLERFFKGIQEMINRKSLIEETKYMELEYSYDEWKKIRHHLAIVWDTLDRVLKDYEDD